MDSPVFAFQLTALSPWAWHGLAVPSGTATLNNVVTDTALAFAVATALGMAPRSPCLPSAPDYRSHLAVLPFKTTLFLGHDNRLNRPLARRLNLDIECGMPKSIHDARTSGNVKDYYHIQEVAVGSAFYGCFLHADPLSMAQEACGAPTERLVVRLGRGRNGVGLLERCADQPDICLNLHTARLFDADIDLTAGPYHLHNIQPSRPLDAAEALRITAGWSWIEGSR